MEGKINRKIDLLNSRGIPVIFVVTGNNSSGKTVLTKKLIQKLNFYQSVNLGLVSKLIHLFRPDFSYSELENFDGNVASKLFKRAVEFIVDAYSNTGVNIIIDGLQVDTQLLFKNKRVIGGVIIITNSKLVLRRGNHPETHFNRQIKGLKKVKYVPTTKFKLIDNNGALRSTYQKTINHLNYLLDEELKTPKNLWTRRA